MVAIGVVLIGIAIGAFLLMGELDRQEEFVADLEETVACEEYGLCD